MKNSRKQAFSLVELLVVIALVAIILPFATTAIYDARTNAVLTQAMALRVRLNDFARQMRNDYAQYGETPGTIGSDKEAALATYYANGFIAGTIDLRNVDFINGVWVADPQY